MAKVLLSAFACDPTKGSEPGNGWNWAEGLAKRGNSVHCLTRVVGKSGISGREVDKRLIFHYIILPLGLEKLYGKGGASMYLYYLLWQWFAYRYAKKLAKTVSFDVVQHVTWGSIQMGSFLYKLDIPFIFGPSGGGQEAPQNFKAYFQEHWKEEINRKKVADLLIKYNPAFKKMLVNAHTVLVSNEETLYVAKTNGARNVALTLDAALPKSFYPDRFEPKNLMDDKLQLLWVGRFMPRKGILMLLDVMKELKTQKNITLTVVGDGEMKDEFLRGIAAYEIEDTVKWVGKVPYEAVREYYASHDMFLFASLRDSCPAQLIEAMAFGMPIITIDLHGQALIVNEKNGIKCKCETPEIAVNSLKNAILSMSSNNDRFTEMSSEAYKFASAQSWENKISNIVEKYYPKVENAIF